MTFYARQNHTYDKRRRFFEFIEWFMEWSIIFYQFERMNKVTSRE